MRYALSSLLFAGALALSFGAARADVLVLTSSALNRLLKKSLALGDEA